MLLPSDGPLEHEIHGLGVSSKQTDRARQAFQRSAEQAGFFDTARDRLTLPNVGKPLSDDADKLGSKHHLDPIGGGKMRSNLRPEVVDLLATLVDNGAGWTPEKIAEFVDAARKLNALLTTD